MPFNYHNIHTDERRVLASGGVSSQMPDIQARICLRTLARQLAIGDVVFIRVPDLPFVKVAQTTASWTNHVGIVVDTNGPEPRVAESKFPFSKTTTLSRFIARSVQQRVAVHRLAKAPNTEQCALIQQAALKRLGIFYDTGFNLHSRRQFCSRFVHEIMAEATGIQLGEIESFSVFLERNPQVDLAFWRWWYLGKIPWQRQTITPASLLQSSALRNVFNGHVEEDRKEVLQDLGIRGVKP